MQRGPALPDRRLPHLPRRLVIGLAGLLVLGAVVLWIARARSVTPQSLFTVAVLPLAPLSGEPGNAEAADAMTEQLTLALSEVDGFRVTSRTSASRFKGKPLDPAAIGPPWVVDAEHVADIPQSSRRQQRVAQRVDGHVAVGMSGATVDVGEQQTQQPARPTGLYRVHVGAQTYPKVHCFPWTEGWPFTVMGNLLNSRDARSGAPIGLILLVDVFPVFRDDAEECSSRL